jgi:hypothetical protein
MKYLMTIKMNEKYRNVGGPPQALLDAMGPFVEQGFKSGKIVDTGGLKPSKDAVRLRVENGKLTVKDGPFTEAKEVIGGWAIAKVADRAEALKIATDFMELHRKHWPGWEGTSEIYEMEEYTP